MRDSLEAPAVTIINQRFAKEHWPNEDAVGKRFKIGFLSSDNPWMTVVGVVENFHHGGLDVEQAPTFYRPYQQAAWPVMSILVKTASAPEPLTPQIVKAVAVAEPDQPVSGVRTMEAVLGNSLQSRRFPMYLLSGFAVLALVLAAVGIAGVVGYSVVQRTPEIGVRVALGAQRVRRAAPDSRPLARLGPRRCRRWRSAGRSACCGCSARCCISVTSYDPVVLGSVSVLLIGVVLAASYLPARRAMRVDAVTALRQS